MAPWRIDYSDQSRRRRTGRGHSSCPSKRAGALDQAGGMWRGEKGVRDILKVDLTGSVNGLGVGGPAHLPCFFLPSGSC